MMIILRFKFTNVQQQIGLFIPLLPQLHMLHKNRNEREENQGKSNLIELLMLVIILVSHREIVDKIGFY